MQPHGKHLPGGPGALSKKQVGDQHGHRAHQNPACPPRLTPVRMVNAVTGLHWGAQKKAPRPATPSPHRQASSTSSRGPGPPLLKPEKAGQQALHQKQQADPMILLPLKQKLPGQQGQSAQNKGYPHHRQLTPGRSVPGRGRYGGRLPWFPCLFRRRLVLRRAGQRFPLPTGFPAAAEMTSSGVIPWGRYARTIRWWRVYRTVPGKKGPGWS